MRKKTSLNIIVFLLLTLVILGFPNSLQGQQQKHAKYALLVGVSRYSHANLNQPTLEYPEVDSTAVAKLLKTAGYHVVILNGKDATQKRIQTELSKISMQGSDGGAALIGFFGHGVQYGSEAWYCPYDTSFREAKNLQGQVRQGDNGQPLLEADPKSMVSLNEALSSVRLSGANNRIILADCCRNDPLGARDVAFGSSLQLSDLPDGTIAIFACSKGERAFEHKSWGHGAFTRAFLYYVAEIHRTAGNVKAGTLADNLNTGVTTMVAKFNRRQTVNWLSSGKVDLCIDLPKTMNVPSNPKTNTTSEELPKVAIIIPLDKSDSRPSLPPKFSFDSIKNLSTDSYSRAMLYLASAESVDRLNQDSTKLIQKALDEAQGIEDSRRAMECSFQIANTIAFRKVLDTTDVKNVQEALKQVEADGAALKPVRNGKWSNEEIVLTKYLTQIRAAALYWRTGQKKLADETSQSAYPKSKSRNFYYDLPVYQAILIFAESGDLNNIARFQHIQNGEIKFYELMGSRPYVSLTNPSLFQSKRPTENGSIYETILSHAELTKSYGRAGKTKESRIHYRAAKTFIANYTTGQSYGNWVKSEVRARLAISEAFRGDFGLATSRIKNELERESIRGEAAYQLCLRQLASKGNVRGGGIDGAIQTLEIVKREPSAVMLAFEIARVYKKADPTRSIQWANTLSSPLKEAALIGFGQK